MVSDRIEYGAVMIHEHLGIWLKMVENGVGLRVWTDSGRAEGSVIDDT